VTPPSIEDRHSLDNNLSNPLLISSFCTASFITLIYLQKFIYTALNEIYDLHSPLRSVTITTCNHLINATVDCYQVISLALESLHPCSYSSCEQIHRAQGTGTLQIDLFFKDPKHHQDPQATTSYDLLRPSIPISVLKRQIDLITRTPKHHQILGIDSLLQSSTFDLSQSSTSDLLRIPTQIIDVKRACFNWELADICNNWTTVDSRHTTSTLEDLPNNNNEPRHDTSGTSLPPLLFFNAIAEKTHNFFTNLEHDHCYSIRTHAEKCSCKTLRCWWKQNESPTDNTLHPQPHKDQDLSGHGRGWIWNYKQTTKQFYYSYQTNLLVARSEKSTFLKINPTKAHSLLGSGRGWFVIHRVCCVYLKPGHTSHNMASSSTRRQILHQDLDSMEIDSPPQASTQKRLTDKDIATKTSSGKRSKPMTYTSVPEQRLPRYWLGFSYMKQIAIDRDLPEYTNSEPLEDLMT
jgi:hypothetical protein